MFTKEHFDKIASVLNAARNSYDASAIAAAHGSETESIVHAELGKLIDNISGQFADILAEPKTVSDIWHDNSVQFPRLIAEIVATQALDMPALCESMGLLPEDVVTLFDRAQIDWERIKQSLTP